MNATSHTLPASVKRIWHVTVGAPDEIAPRVLYEQPQQRRKVAKLWRPADRFLRQFAQAQSRFAAEYLDRHETSSAKKKNGAIRDLRKNVAKSRKAGGKSMRWKKIFQL